MADRRQVTTGPGYSSPGRALILLALVGLLITSLGCALGERLGFLARAVAGGSHQTAVARNLVTYTPAPTFTPTPLPLPSPTPTATFIPWPTPTATQTSIPTPSPPATPTFALLPSATPRPTDTPLPARPPATVAPSPATPTPAPTPAPSYDYLVSEVYIDRTTVPFLTGYIAIVNAQEIPIGGVKVVGVFEPGGQRHESPLSKWFFDVATAPGAVAKSGSVKFEPGGIQAGTWFIHLENEQGVRLSEDLAINTDPANPEWFYVKFKQRGSAVASVPTQPRSSSPVPTATSVRSGSATSGWSFVGVRSFYDPDWESVLVYGEAVNNTGSSQELFYITGTFYDAQGQVVADQYDADDYWPIDVVPNGAQVPFEISLWDIDSVADFDLRVISEPSSDAPRQDFEFLGLDASGDARDYCVVGRLRNSGGQLEDYLAVVAVLYDEGDKVINFDSSYNYSPEVVTGDRTLDFEVCVDPLGQEVGYYELRAWGE
jgi:hypothetical protein